MLQPAPLETLLATLDRDQLLALLAHLVERRPAVIPLIPAPLAVLQHPPNPPPANAPRRREGEPPLDPAPYRTQVRTAVRSIRRGGSYDYGMVGAIVREVGGVAEEARPHVEAGDGRSALAI